MERSDCHTVSKNWLYLQYLLKRSSNSQESLNKSTMFCVTGPKEIASTSSVMTEFFWRRGLHLNNDRTCIFTSKLADLPNDFSLNKSNWPNTDKTNLGKKKFTGSFDSSMKLNKVIALIITRFE